MQRLTAVTLLLATLPLLAGADEWDAELEAAREAVTQQQRMIFDGLDPALRHRVFEGIEKTRYGQRAAPAGKQADEDLRRAFAGAASDPEIESEVLRQRMTPRQRLAFDQMEPARQREIVNVMKRPLEAPTGASIAETLRWHVQGFPPETQAQLNAALRERAGELDAEQELFLGTATELDDGREELEEHCARFNDAEREAMCARWARELERLPGVSSGPEGDGGDASDRLGKMFHDRQLRASELGMRMMVESCGCDDFD